MKKQSVQAIVKGIILSGILTAGTFIQANANNSGETVTAKAVAEFKYAGSSKDQASFNIKFNNPSGEKFTLLVLDAKGDLFFKESYTSKEFAKRFVLAKEDAEKLTFRIQSGKQSFDENINLFQNETEARKAAVQQ
ncbi:hypothetical protein [Sediminibacterium sp.]|uniref:hypothetical protein n=1 Tax=Sediminibacterium sp. TaxID=1917865 RepID=UPI0025E8E141|nr:hypothetical protein [Sediminibacterium sp.]MBW0178954.1 hypothetical protein [Sediminibacterium sp.]